MTAKIFADTNVWIYAHLQKESDSRCKHASELVRNKLLRDFLEKAGIQ